VTGQAADAVRPRILCVGAYERDNFGDLLFQLVTAEYLKDADVVFAAPFAADMSALTGERIPAFGPLLASERFDAVWTVGGEVGATTVGFAHKAALGAEEHARYKAASPVERRRLLAEHRDDVFGALDGTADASAETLELVRAWLRSSGLPTAVDPDEHPLAAAGMLVQEDLCLMVRHEDGWHLDAAVLCFPTLWLLADKLGRVNAEVHGPVPHFAEELLARVDGFFDRLRPERPVWRRNLSVTPGPLLCLAARALEPPAGPVTLAPDGSPLWLRSERQTLRLLPRSGAILFTIRVQTAPIGVLRERRDRAADLAAMYTSWDTAAHGYKMGGDSLVPALRDWLATLT